MASAVLGAASIYAEGISEAGSVVGFFYNSGSTQFRSTQSHGFVETSGVYFAFDTSYPAAYTYLKASMTRRR